MKQETLTNNFITTAGQGFIELESIEWEPINEGIRRKIIGYDENLMMVISEFKKGAVGSVHAHPHRQVTYITKGLFEVQIENEKKILKDGDSFFTTPSLNHGVIALEDSTLIDVFAPCRKDFLNK